MTRITMTCVHVKGSCHILQQSMWHSVSPTLWLNSDNQNWQILLTWWWQDTEFVMAYVMTAYWVWIFVRTFDSPALPSLCSGFGWVTRFLASCPCPQQSPRDQAGSLALVSSYLLLSGPPFPQNSCTEWEKERRERGRESDTALSIWATCVMQSQFTFTFTFHLHLKLA